MKKKVKKFAMGGMGSNTSPIQTRARLAPPPDRVDGAPIRTLGMQNQQAGMGRGGMGGMNVQQAGRVGMNAQQAVRGGMGEMGAMSGMNAQQFEALKAALTAQDKTYQAGRGGLGGMGGMGGAAGLASVRNPGNLPASQALSNMQRQVLSGRPIQSSVNSTTTRDMMGGAAGLGSVRNPGNLPPIGNLRNAFDLMAGAKGKLFKKGGAVKASKSVSSASKRADGIAMKGKTKGRIV